MWAMPNPALPATGHFKERGWLTLFACRILMGPCGRAPRYAFNMSIP